MGIPPARLHGYSSIGIIQSTLRTGKVDRIFTDDPDYGRLTIHGFIQSDRVPNKLLTLEDVVDLQVRLILHLCC
uniref:Transposase n=1 Tax=Ascaris lumbricoides TaxID=6252 RepID=A0A0M3IQA9_ASCLU